MLYHVFASPDGNGLRSVGIFQAPDPQTAVETFLRDLESDDLPIVHPEEARYHLVDGGQGGPTITPELLAKIQREDRRRMRRELLSGPEPTFLAVPQGAETIFLRTPSGALQPRGPLPATDRDWWSQDFGEEVLG